ncbi:DUF421 domain-containing protein [Bacillus hwajinpoensis]|uniref:DUF421 domain-containing protein n=1 Tax=Guptibacillus hwajinpoensis TaxID=208199 RepID=A0A845F4E7_9BACL|nr:YetF domain-containing protein [Pseudalkalibacillus hwajinpoensis]MYL65843.1 DUF421 domain-containing protein [Pseudalkalibacillus hwajinpoensis]
MDFDLLWKAVLIVIGGTLLLRVAGRKSISQMTLAQVVIMIGIGSLLIQPIVGKNVFTTLLVGLALVLTLVIVEYSQLKFDWLEQFITGRSKILIKNGVLQENNLKRLRFTVDQLEMKLRQSQIHSISDVAVATLEPNGQLGFQLKEMKQPATKEEVAKIYEELKNLNQVIHGLSNSPVLKTPPPNSVDKKSTLFDEVGSNVHIPPVPNKLQ